MECIKFRIFYFLGINDKIGNSFYTCINFFKCVGFYFYFKTKLEIWRIILLYIFIWE